MHRIVSRLGPRIDSYDDPRVRARVEWIPIEERWPPGSVPVLVFLGNGSYAVLNRYRGDWWPGEISCDESFAWVHLPKPPDMVVVPRKPRDRKRPKTSKPARGARKKADLPRKRKGRAKS